MELDLPLKRLRDSSSRASVAIIVLATLNLGDGCTSDRSMGSDVEPTAVSSKSAILQTYYPVRGMMGRIDVMRDHVCWSGESSVLCAEVIGSGPVSATSAIIEEMSSKSVSMDDSYICIMSANSELKCARMDDGVVLGRWSSYGRVDSFSMGSRTCFVRSGSGGRVTCVPEDDEEPPAINQTCGYDRSSRSMSCVFGPGPETTTKVVSFDPVGISDSHAGGCVWSRRELDCIGFSIHRGVHAMDNPRPFVFENGIVQVDVGEAGVCVLDGAGDVWCIGISTSIYEDPVSHGVGLYSDPIQVYSGVVHMGSDFGLLRRLSVCAIDRNEQVSCITFPTDHSIGIGENVGGVDL